MATRQRLKRPFEKVYSSVPTEVKEVLQQEADRRGLQVSDVIRELLMEKYGDEVGRQGSDGSGREPRPEVR